MSIFNLFRRQGSAPVARDRLQILLAHERSARGQSDLLGIVREEILAVIAKHVIVDHDHLIVRMDRGATVSTLEIEIEIPTPARPAMPVGKLGWEADWSNRALSVFRALHKLPRSTGVMFLGRLSGKDASPG